MADFTVRPLAAPAGEGALRSSWRAAWGAALLSLIAAWIHFAFVEDHWRDWWAYGAFFVACGVGQALLVPAILRWPRTWVVVCGIVGNIAIIAMYVWSRTIGIPVGPHARVVEKASASDLFCTGVEIALVGVLLVMLGRTGRRWVVNALLLAGIVLWVGRFVGYMP